MKVEVIAAKSAPDLQKLVNAFMERTRQQEAAIEFTFHYSTCSYREAETIFSVLIAYK